MIFERAFDLKALSSFSCDVREIEFMIHRKSEGLREFIAFRPYSSKRTVVP